MKFTGSGLPQPLFCPQPRWIRNITSVLFHVFDVAIRISLTIFTRVPRHLRRTLQVFLSSHSDLFQLYLNYTVSYKKLEFLWEAFVPITQPARWRLQGGGGTFEHFDAFCPSIGPYRPIREWYGVDSVQRAIYWQFIQILGHGPGIAEHSVVTWCHGQGWGQCQES